MHGKPIDSDAAILLATYNGEEFLAPLLDSIRRQTHQSWCIYWRDDGSSDGTKRIVRERVPPERLVELSFDARLGPAASFLRLLKRAAGHHATYHFADQDDLWRPSKLERAHVALTSRSHPTLIHCRQELIDANGKSLGYSVVPGAPSFENAVVENIVVGCSSAFNDAAARLGAEGAPTHALMHDWWMYLVTSCFGEIVYDPESLIQYRQHANNLVGSNRGGLASIRAKMRRHFSRSADSSPICGQLSDLLAIHGHRLDAGQRGLVNELLDGKRGTLKRLRLALTTRSRRQSPLDQVLLRAVLLTGRY